MIAKANTIQDLIDKEFTVPPPEEDKEPKVLTEEKKEQKNKLEAEKAEIESKISEIDAMNSVVKKTIPKVKKRDSLSILFSSDQRNVEKHDSIFLSKRTAKRSCDLIWTLFMIREEHHTNFSWSYKVLNRKGGRVECAGGGWKEKKKKGKKDDVENTNQVL